MLVGGPVKWFTADKVIWLVTYCRSAVKYEGLQEPLLRLRGSILRSIQRFHDYLLLLSV